MLGVVPDPVHRIMLKKRPSQLLNGPTEQCLFIYPFPASRLSSGELLRALSAWLMPTPSDSPCISVDDENDDLPLPPLAYDSENDDESCSSTTVPMVFSHDEWFVQCVPALGVQLDRLLTNQQHGEEEVERQLQYEEESRIRLILRHLLALTLRIPSRTRHRDQMRLFIDVFGTLLRCSAQPSHEHTKRLAQRMLVVLLNRFEPVAQFMLLSRLFQLLVQRKLPLSHEAYEPQLMAWLVDIYRTKCYAKTEQEADTTPPNTAAENGNGTEKEEAVGELFRKQLGHFYAQIGDIVFEDPLASVNFYASVCLLLVGQALNRHRPALLRQMGPSWLNRVREQVCDWRTMDEANKAAQQQQQWQTEQKQGDDNQDGMAVQLNRQMAQTLEQQQLYRLNMLSFQFDEAERCVEKSLNSATN